MADFVAETIALRDKAWSEVESTPQYKAYAALKAAVEAMAPPPEVGKVSRSRPLFGPDARPYSAVAEALKARRISQPDAAILALEKSGKPMSAHELMAAAVDQGAVVGGERPITNFTSSLSKDDRLYSFREGGMYFWWFTARELPEGWNETEPSEFERLLGSASSSSSEKGGDGHGPATT